MISLWVGWFWISSYCRKANIWSRTSRIFSGSNPEQRPKAFGTGCRSRSYQEVCSPDTLLRNVANTLAGLSINMTRSLRSWRRNVVLVDLRAPERIFYGWRLIRTRRNTRLVSVREVLKLQEHSADYPRFARLDGCRELHISRQMGRCLVISRNSEVGTNFE